jgi:hypothetical protein
MGEFGRPNLGPPRSSRERPQGYGVSLVIKRRRANTPRGRLPKNAAWCVVIDQACTAAILGSGRHPGFRRIGSAVAMSAHSQSRQTETDYHCAHGDNRSHRPLRRLGPERLLPMLRGMTLSQGERYEEFHCPGVMRLTRGSGRRHEIADRRSAPACGSRAQSAAFQSTSGVSRVPTVRRRCA